MPGTAAPSFSSNLASQLQIGMGLTCFTACCRIHGQVSRAPAQWRRVPAVHQSELQDVVYEKAVGEGIAKASYTSSPPASCGSQLVSPP